MKKAFNLIGEINQLLKLDFQKLITFDWLLRNWKVGEQKAIENTSNRLLIKTKDHLRFITEIQPNASFIEHWHDCEEQCKVISGVMKDRSNPKMTWSMNETAVYRPFVPHVPYNPSSTETLILQVDFYKRKNSYTS